MGTTAEKLTYLNTTKGKIKDSINLTGAGITTEPFRQYAVKLKDAYVDIINNGTDTLYNNFPKVSGSGTDLSLTPTYEAPMQIDLKGNTSQEQLSGINIYNVHGTASGVSDEVNIDSNDYINVTYNNTSGTSDHYSNVMLYKTPQLQPSTNYLIVCEIKSVSGTGILYPFTKHTNGCIDTQHSLYNFTGLSAGQKILLPVTTKTDISSINTDLRSIVRYNAGQSGSITFRLSLLTDTTITPSTFVYQKYVGGTPSPNPSYPQDIHNVSGNNSVVVWGKNYYNYLERATETKNTIVCTNNNDGTFTFNGTASANAQFPLKSSRFLMSFLNGKTFQPFIVGDNLKCYITYYDINGTYQDMAQITNDGIYFNNINSNYYSANIYYYVKNGDKVENAIGKPMIELGNTKSNFEAYTGATYPINLPSGMELNTIGTYEDSFLRNSGKNLFDKDNANVINGYIRNEGTNFVITSQYTNKTIMFVGKPNTTYTISKKATDRFRVGLYNSALSEAGTYDLSSIIRNDSGTKITITTTSTYYYIYAHILETYDLDEVLATIQIEEGSTATSYEPYGNGEWYLNKNTGKVVFDGSENWATSGAVVPSGVSAYSNNTNSGFISNTQGYSNLFTIIDNATDWNVPSGNGTARYTSNQLYIKILTSIASDVNTLKTWLGNNNITMYGILSTPTYTKITDTTLLSQLEAIYNAKSKNGTTNISQENNDLPFIITASALEKEV